MIFLLCAVLINSNSSLAKTECSVGQDALVGTIHRHSQKIKKIISSQREDYYFSETALLKTGLQVTYRVGGCAHFQMRFTFEKIKQAIPKDKNKLLSFTSQLFSTVPIKDQDKRNIFKNALINAKTTDSTLEEGELELPCGDAQCSLSIAEKGRIILNYDFAL